MKFYRGLFYFLLLVPIFMLVYEVRSTLIDIRHTQKDLYLLHSQSASQIRLIMGLQTRILHYSEEHGTETHIGCPLCFKNLMMEKYDHELIRKFLKENGVDAQSYLEGLNLPDP